MAYDCDYKPLKSISVYTRGLIKIYKSNISLYSQNKDLNFEGNQ